MPINPLDVGHTTTKEYRQDKKKKGIYATTEIKPVYQWAHTGEKSDRDELRCRASLKSYIDKLFIGY